MGNEEFKNRLVTAYIILLMYCGACAACLLQALFTLFFWPSLFCSRRFFIYWIGRIFRRLSYFFVIDLNLFWRVRVVRLSNVQNTMSGRTLILCNHTSQADPYILSKAMGGIEAKWVYKANLTKIPILGWALKMACDLGLVFQKNGGSPTRENVDDLMHRVCYTGEVLNMPVVAFPEGTRSVSGKLQTFRNGFFKLAIEHQFSIVPTVVFKSCSAWPLGGFKMFPATVYVAYGDAIYPLPNESIAQLNNRCREAMIALIKAMPNYDPAVDEPMPKDTPVQSRGHGFVGKERKANV